MTIVVDASIVFAVHFPDEASDIADEAMERVLSEGGIVPFHWHAEIGNGFAIAVRRGRLDSAFRAEALRLLADFPIEVDVQSRDQIWTETQMLCDRHNLTAYDAAYLELALRRKLPLATLDKSLAKAAQNESLNLLAV